MGIETQFMVVNVHFKHHLCSSMVDLYICVFSKFSVLSCHFH